MMEQPGYDERAAVLARIRERLIAIGGEEMRSRLDDIDRRQQEQMEKNRANDEYRRRLAASEIERYNAMPGNLTGYDCPKCKNRGDFLVPYETGTSIKYCDCMKVRRALKNMKNSGLAGVLDTMNFESFETKEPFQKAMYETAKEFLKSHDAWLYIGGQVGAGKTHICTAVCGELLNAGKEVVYMLWKDEATRLKGMVNDADYSDEIGRFKRCDVLYIDDLFKPVTADRRVSPGDVNLLFEIINSRYAGKRRTILSSERPLFELMDIDQATGSRIYQMSKGFQISIAEGKEKNRRIV